ncbi:hypothetical protein ABNavy97_072 [Acinetobacter phage AB-Navy97]|uniref:Thymidylate kinase n=4 Tax=Lazarusvirus TaxID=2842820 RepID=A0A4Y1NKM6_9CAUD|nr:thymidylate kinase [Acinetobacter phage vB_AbaM_Berthold]YP_009886847.1 thymidylate kinase [Acinetobacter phage vB_AbaM_Lazarus]YP_009889703.1 thymidylate kinase [Acinetobacter phage AM101]QKN88016.1 putative thymidylate kinase [Acinetobacter phage Abraxas]UJH94864.1 putative nucleotide triphosphate hydrolase [Acinetobacter phage PhaR5]UNI74511.1 hypothetical protein ABNavy4_073 [Acinetobacter phage AB-Navy4]UNI74756.1 hypothetical protein ABNavy97_072 [Acinetobacter phage AB-Navy97]UYL85
MAKIILVEGPDNAGKTTLISNLTRHFDVTLMEFPKRTSEGRFTCLTRNEVAIFETMLNYVDNSKTYVLDRGGLSNIVYESVLRGKPVEIFKEDFRRFIQNNEVLVIGLTRNKLVDSFTDDLITVSEDQFNAIVDRFNEVYDEFNITPYKILDHDVHNNINEAKSFTDVVYDLNLENFIGA